MTFDPESPKWRTCCCHVATFVKVTSWIGAIVTAFLFIMSIAVVILVLINPPQGELAGLQWLFFIYPLFILVIFIFYACPIIAIRKTIPWLMIPLIVSYVINLLFIPANLILAYVLRKDLATPGGYYLAAGIFFLPQIFVLLWLLSVTIRCYLYLKGLKDNQYPPNYDMQRV